MGTGELNAGCNPVMDWHPIHVGRGGGGGVEILLVASYHRIRDKLRPDGRERSLSRRRLFLLCVIFILALNANFDQI